MGTRCCINFTFGDREDVDAKVYRHSDGYPEGVLPDLEKFFADVKAQCGADTRFDDPSYLAARFIVWQAWQYNDSDLSRLDFTGVGVTLESPDDIAYEYLVHCKDRDETPTVTHRRTR